MTFRIQSRMWTDITDFITQDSSFPNKGALKNFNFKKNLIVAFLGII